MLEKHRVIFLLLSLIFVYVSSTLQTCGPKNKVKLSETVLNNDDDMIDDWGIHFASDDNQIIFVRTIKSKIYQSFNEGLSWTEVNTNSSNGVKSIKSTEVSLNQKSDITVYMMGTSGGLYSSSDSGRTFNYYSEYTFIDIIPHPSVNGLALASRSNGKETHEVWITENYGKDFQKILEASYQEYWSIFDNISNKRIYALVPTGSGVRFDNQIIYSEDIFRTPHPLDLSYVLGMHIWTPNKFVALTCDMATGCYGKMLYIWDADSSSFNLQKFPDLEEEVEEESNIFIQELSDDAIWTFVVRDCTAKNCYGDLFHSTASDRDFALALKYGLQWHFTKYRALRGIYLANQFVTIPGIPPQDDDSVRSLITFNKGSRWNIIQAPEMDSLGQKTDCSLSNGCSLHLHGYRADHPFTYFYSIPNAPGLMVASGNYGNQLLPESSTFVSWNGGINWTEVSKSNFVPEIGDHGSVIVMVKEEGEVDTVLYTINDGKDWNSCLFTDKKFDVSNIRVDPEWDSTRFLLYGYRVENGKKSPVVVQLNFEEEYTGQCGGADLEQWSPTDENGFCILGEASHYHRRYKGKECYFGTGFQPYVGGIRCNCTYEDYECAHCFNRPELGDQCTLECAVADLPAPTVECSTSTHYSSDVAYRLVDSTVCLNPNKDKPKGLIPCPKTPLSPPGIISSGLTVVPIILVVIVFLGGIAALIFVLYKRNNSFRDFITYTLGFNINETESNYSTVEQADSLTT